VRHGRTGIVQVGRRRRPRDAIVEEVADENQELVLEAASSCPEQAITVMIEQVAAARASHGQRLER